MFRWYLKTFAIEEGQANEGEQGTTDETAEKYAKGSQSIEFYLNFFFNLKKKTKLKRFDSP